MACFILIHDSITHKRRSYAKFSTGSIDFPHLSTGIGK